GPTNAVSAPRRAAATAAVAALPPKPETIRSATSRSSCPGRVGTTAIVSAFTDPTNTRSGTASPDLVPGPAMSGDDLRQFPDVRQGELAQRRPVIDGGEHMRPQGAPGEH